jgi:hypothetical protein
MNAMRKKKIESNLPGKPKRRWQVNFVIVYYNTTAATCYRKPILDLLQSIAFLQGINCAVSCNHPFFHEPDFEAGIIPECSQTDLVYFQSSGMSGIDAANFRKLIKHVFQYRHPRGNPYEVFSQLQKHIRLYPFPPSPSGLL